VTHASEVQKEKAIRQHSVQAEEFAERYRAQGSPYRSCFAYSRHRLDQWMDRFLPPGPGARLLDVGCGTGHHLARFRERGFDVAGVDGSEEMLDQARLLNPGADLRRADVEGLPFPDGTFDVVVCVEVLRYLPRPTGCVREMARVLKPGGLCLATATPLFNANGYWLVNRLAGLVRGVRLVRLRQFFTTSWGVRREFARAGFLTPEVHGVYGGPINWAERLVPGTLPRLLAAWEPLDGRLADCGPLREFANMFLVRAVRQGERGKP
jgi:SAM-dependent methyltransferase